MAKTFRPFLQAIQAIKITCVLLLAIPTPISSATIDEAILTGDTGLNAFDAFHVNENYTILLKVELDMLLPVEQYNKVYQRSVSGQNKRNAINLDFFKWPNATMYYEIDGTVLRQTSIIRETLDHWVRYTCMVFREEERVERVQFKSGISCRSHVGNQHFTQPITLAYWCMTKPIIAHEVGHAVGLYHEHSRSDRDSYIQIVRPKAVVELYFPKITYGVSSYGVPYDYLSIMQYGPYEGISSLDPAYQKRIGRSPGLSYKDIKQVNLMYGCAKLRANCPEKACPFNGFVFFKPFHGLPACECFCDSGDQDDPLIPCSQITKEIPGPNIPDASSLASEDPNPCFDLRPNCDSLKTQGLCKSELTLMDKQCTKTCGFCGKDKNLCIDFDPACEAMAASCTDDNLKELMNKLCRKTCKLCTNSSNMCDIQQALSGSGAN